MRGLRWGEAGKGILGQKHCAVRYCKYLWGGGSRQREQQVLRTVAEALTFWPPDEKS